MEAYVEFGTKTAEYTSETKPSIYPADKPIQIVIDGLEQSTKYYYRLLYRKPGSKNFKSR